MGNCLCKMRQELEQTEEWEPHQLPPIMMSRGCCHCGRIEKDWTCPLLGSCSCAQNALPLSSCVFYSPRIQDLIEGERSELETTQAHWTQVNDKNDVEMVRVGKENRKYFDKVLMKDARWGGFFSKFEGLILKKKIGEGGQAGIFEARMKHRDYKDERLVAKVFKMNIPLRDLKQQWPLEDLCGVSGEFNGIWSPFMKVYGGAFIREGIHKNRFAFVMERRVCDLRAFIDERMLELVRSNCHGPPFNDFRKVLMILACIAHDMNEVHEHGVVHRDIKASNVLIGDNRGGLFNDCHLMDFECSLGTMGTGFWRAPEILEQVERRVPSHELVFTKESDIYSFGMLCYEVVTGRVPFDGHPQNDYSIVLEGGRPELPSNLDAILRGLILACWQGNPQYRPTSWQVRMIITEWVLFKV